MNQTAFEEDLSERLRALADHAPTVPTRQPGYNTVVDLSNSRFRWLAPAAAAFLVLMAGVGIWALAGNETSFEVVTSDGAEGILSTTVPELAPSSTPSDAPQSPGISVGDLPSPIDLMVLSVRPNNLSLAVIDLSARTTRTYPPGSTALGPGAASGVAITPRGDIAVWEQSSLYVFPGGDLNGAPLELSPSQINAVPGVAVELWVQPSADGEQVWIVQPAYCCGPPDTKTIIDRVDVDTSETLTTVTIDEQGFPIGETDEGLIMNLVGDYVDTGDGFVADPLAAHISVISADGEVADLGAGVALATWRGYVVLQRPDDSDLTIHNLADGSEAIVAPGESGAWSTVGGPSIPSTSQPLPTVSDEGRLLIAKLGPEVDETGNPTSSSMYAIDLESADTTRLASFDSWPPQATWSADGQWLLMVRGSDLELRSLTSGETIFLPDAIPQDHFVLGAG